MCATGAGLQIVVIWCWKSCKPALRMRGVGSKTLWVHHHKIAKHFNLIFSEFSTCGTERWSSPVAAAMSEGALLAADPTTRP